MLVTGASLDQGGHFPREPLAPALTYTFQQVAIIVESLLAVALIAGLCVYTLAFLADLCSEQYALVDI